ncbi:MAG: PIN domain-containing protein [Chloroflexota bacterium]|nr:PIN domain-containing protein [Chloroflexota bacterium]
MNVASALQDAKRIYIDTAPFIYFVERHRDYFTRMFRVIGLIETSPIQAITSVLTLTELMVQPLKTGNDDLAKRYRDILVSRDDYTLVTVSADIAILAGEIRAQYSLRIADAIHVATAIATDCDSILTNDAAMKRLTDLNVLHLDDLEL